MGNTNSTIEQDWLDELRADDREARLREETQCDDYGREADTEYNRTRGV